MDTATTDARNSCQCATGPIGETCASYVENVQAREQIHVNLPASLDTGVEPRPPINSSRGEAIENFLRRNLPSGKRFASNFCRHEVVCIGGG
jgi:hypothetical protein